MLLMESDKGSRVVGILYRTVNRVLFVPMNVNSSVHSNTRIQPGPHGMH